VFGWFKRRQPAVRTLRLRSRGDAGDATRVAFQDLAPSIDTFLGQAAYLHRAKMNGLARSGSYSAELETQVAA